MSTQRTACANNSDNMSQIMTRPVIVKNEDLTTEQLAQKLKPEPYIKYQFNNSKNRAQQSSNISNLMNHENYGQHPADPIKPSKKPGNTTQSYQDLYNPIQVRSTNQLGSTDNQNIVQDRPRSPKKRFNNNKFEEDTKERGDPITWQQKLERQNVSHRRSIEISSKDSRTNYRSGMAGSSMRDLINQS